MTHRIDVKILQVRRRLECPLLFDKSTEGSQKLASAPFVVVDQRPDELVDKGHQSHGGLLLEEAMKSGQALGTGNFTVTASETERCACLPDAPRNLRYLDRASVPANQAKISGSVVHGSRSRRDYESRFGSICDESTR